MDVKKEDLEGFVCFDEDAKIEVNLKLDADLVEDLNKLLKSGKFLFSNSKLEDMVTYLLVEPIDECLKQLEENEEN